MLIRLAILGFLAAACNVGPGAQPAESVAGRQFLSTSVSENGQPRPLEAGTRIQLAFEEVRLSANAGCNTMNGGYTITAGQLLVGDLATTMMACAQPLMNQDQWLAAFLNKRPLIRLTGSDLTLEADGTIISFVDREVAEPDAELVGTLWTLESVTANDAVSVYNVTPAPRLVLAPGGNVTLTTGCNDGFGTYTATDTTITFSALGTTRKACEPHLMTLESQILTVLGAGEVQYHVDGSSLTLTAGDNGLTYRAIGGA
jgi:heat shock protein HslJ